MTNLSIPERFVAFNHPRRRDCAGASLDSHSRHRPPDRDRDPAGAAERPPQTPHVLPASGAKAAAAEPSTWLVGARPGADTAAIARRHGATLLSPRGGFEVARSHARAFAAELKRAGVYIYAEPNQPVHRLQDPTPTPTPFPTPRRSRRHAAPDAHAAPTATPARRPPRLPTTSSRRPTGARS